MKTLLYTGLVIAAMIISYIFGDTISAQNIYVNLVSYFN